MPTTLPNFLEFIQVQTALRDNVASIEKGLLVSFVIPVLNGEKDIARCLLSIRSLDFSAQRYEILVMDNGSTDRTREIVCGFGVDLQVVPGVNVGALRNRGVSLARGDYVAFVDADVELMPHWLKNGLAAIERQQVVATGCFPMVPCPATWVQQSWDVHQRGSDLLRERKPIAWLPSMNFLVRRDVFLAVGGFNERLETAEDVDLCYRLGQLGTVINNPDMEAIHWGEAKNLLIFWRKEVWRGMGNLKGVIAHGLRWDEIPSIGYPLYILCILLFVVISCIHDVWDSRLSLTPVSLILLTLPAFILAVDTTYRTRRIWTLPQLFLLYLIYGLARAYSIVRTIGQQKRLRG